MLVEHEGFVQAEKKVCDSSEDLNTFLKKWDERYMNKIKKIELFSDKFALAMDCIHKKRYFVRAFYHIRGHFHDFLWFMGNYAPDLEIKKIILNNISEEFGGDKLSHEVLYENFAAAMGVNLDEEYKYGATNQKFIKDFNSGHIKWLHTHSWAHCLAAFSAYERLDNLDYKHLSNLASRIGASESAKRFFTVHEQVEHFNPMYDHLLKLWAESPGHMKEGFHFIAQHQLKMWENLTEEIKNVHSSYG